jgi:hypothetical protein
MRRLRTVHGLSTCQVQRHAAPQTGSPHDNILPSRATSRLCTCVYGIHTCSVPLPRVAPSFNTPLTRLKLASRPPAMEAAPPPRATIGRPCSVAGAPAVIRRHQKSSEVIRGHQRSSEVIRGHQRSTLLRRWRTLTRGGSSRDLGTWAQVRTSHAPDEGSHWGDEGRRNQAHSRRRVRTCPCTPELHPVDDELLNQMLIRR